MSEDALFILEEGTEVSAKFKGAFCEAKIKKVDRIIKCKVTLKSSSESVTVSESQLVNMSGQALSASELKTGTTVYLGKSDQSPSKLQQALLNRIIDQSVYTVVFNDGDEKCLKRSFIRFKGEKHFLDSETLNNAPLNNPEHFLYPIKSQCKQSPNSSFTEGKNESDIESGSNFSPKKELDNEVDEDQLSITSSSDDYSPEDKDMFVAQLYKFMDDRGTPMNKLPTINKKDIDLHKLFIVVKKFGGFNKVNKQRNWTDVYKRLAMSVPSAANIANLKSSYKR
ncbi:AT-rich interactive domain-containing 4B [Brachionus plicatilis]|uniref:AT-rich interactive domain-containing 4B n=1 Tax=Brachionus plicatilis TaxID=10195 RepID=A0A3M7S455_BRAPC|nr:AT-rich interactive domain-containing 4B [Brachionus plicatilis]